MIPASRGCFAVFRYQGAFFRLVWAPSEAFLIRAVVLAPVEWATRQLLIPSFLPFRLTTHRPG
jgi:hypothetical protein